MARAPKKKRTVQQAPPTPSPKRQDLERRLAEIRALRIAENAVQPPSPEPGLECPQCGCKDLRTIRTTKMRNKIHRRKECRHCGRRVMSVEVIPDQSEKKSWRNR